MKNLFKKPVVKSILGAILFLLLAIQFVPVDRANPAAGGKIKTPAHIDKILKRSCYDCHSNETVWPWYSKVAPVSWLVAKDVREGREELNFSDWELYDRRKQVKKLKKSLKEVEEGEMPLPIYFPMHKDARLSSQDIAALREWINSRTGADNNKDSDL